jgi:hypothetical protein
MLLSRTGLEDVTMSSSIEVLLELGTRRRAVRQAVSANLAFCHNENTRRVSVLDHPAQGHFFK